MDLDDSATVSTTLWARGGKRVFDGLTAALLLILLMPVVGATAILVKATSRGPVMFVQDRAGRNGAVFQLFKFRTMHGRRRPDAKELVPLDHPEITWVGRLLRRFKIDELPQLLHVLRGEMSLVGPRPTLLDQVAAYDAFRRQRLHVRPGITGLAQVYSSASMPWDERILYDIAYVRRCSFRLDVSILVRTLLVLIIGEHRTARVFAGSPYANCVDPPDGYTKKTEVGLTPVRGKR